MKRLEVEKLFSALVIIEKTRKTLAEVIKYRLDANNEGPEEDIGTGCTISELALDVGLGLHDNWGMTLIGARQTNLMERMDSLLRANGFSLQENSSFDSAGDARYYKSDIKTIIATDNMQTRAEALLQMQHDDYSPSHTARISLHGSPVMNARSILHVTKILEREGGIGVCLGEGGKDPRWPKLVHEFMPTTKV
jgi:hypothetical protein